MIEKIFGDLLRSDHAPTDTPNTLNYEAMADVTRMIVAHILRSHPQA